MLFRNRKLVRATACFFLVEMVGNLLAPCLSYASMGPGQPEFTSYESPGASDMVNMTTGDFTYNIPALDIPGPERSFSLPLTYRAGIRLEQEASWVGLGWSLNPGAIARTLNGYPDDAVNDPSTTTYKRDVARGWTGGVPGVLDLAWDSETGHSGTADLIGLVGVGWANGKVASGDLVGVKYSRGQGVSVDPIRMASAALTIATVGAAGSALAAASEVGKSLGTGVGMGVAASMVLGKSGGTAGGFNQPSIRREKRFLHTNYWVFFNDNKAEMMYGSLYFPSMSRAVQQSSTTAEQQRHPLIFQDNTSRAIDKPKVFEYTRNYTSAGTETREVGADLQQYAARGETGYVNSGTNPISIAHDDFSVMGEGVSGSIRPYRLEMGSLAYPKKMTSAHDKYNLVPFVGDYKAGFRYENSLSNGYDYHDYAPPAGGSFVGIDYDANQQALILKDQSLFTTPDFLLSRTAPSRKGIINNPNAATKRGLIQGKHVQWYSNAEIEAMYATSNTGIGNGFLEFDQPATTTVTKRVPLTPICKTTPCPTYSGFNFSFQDQDSYPGGVLAPSGLLVGNGQVDLTSIFKPGDIVRSNATVTHTIEIKRYVNNNYQSTFSQDCVKPRVTDEKIVAVTANTIDISPASRVMYNGQDIQSCVPASDNTVRYEQTSSPVYKSYTTTLNWPYKDSLYTTNNPFRKLMPRNSIGAFSVTAEDGTTYHYSLPVYHFNQFSKSQEINTSDPGTYTQTLGAKGRAYGYATAWLLTAITSPDYVDRGQLGIVDKDDWGGWVKFNYGKFSKRYKWRQPYIGEAYAEDDKDKFGNINNGNYSEGSKQTYYLNSITTRTHTALFIKSVRNDARGHFNPGADSTRSSLGIDETTPSSSLRLDEIVLLTNEELAKLQQINGIRQPDDNGSAIPALSANTANNSNTFNGELGNQDNYAFVYDRHDVEVDARIRNYISQKAVKRVVFNYSYRLCPGTPNSFASLGSLPPMDEANMSVSRTGKLTLESLATYGPQNTKLIPDFVFTYGPNPSYSKEKWDGFGFYNSTGQRDLTSHNVSANTATATADGAAWSLTEILNPLGSVTQIQYERDQYARVSEHGLASVPLYADGSTNTLTMSTNEPWDLTAMVKVGDVIRLNGTTKAWYPACSKEFERSSDQEPYTVTAVTASTVTVTTGPWHPMQYYGCGSPDVSTIKFNGYVLLPKNTNGGDLRVAAVRTVGDNNAAYVVKYKYVDGGSAQSNSSGVISKLPEFIPHTNFPFYQWFDYPATSIMYGKVSVLRGTFKNNDDTDYEQREEYSFFTPASSMVRQDLSNNTSLRTTMADGRVLDRRRNKTTVDVGKIGQPVAIRRYNRAGHQEFATTFTYTSNIANAAGINGQGRFTEGALTTELVNSDYRINRSVKEYLPTIMATTTTVANGVRVESANTLYDFFSGQVLETTAKNSLGDTYRTKTVPAYTLAPYAGMGPKGENAVNSNMLSQPAAFYTYKQADGGPSSLVSASVQTWKSNFSTRDYVDAVDKYQEVAPEPKPLWRQHESFVWNSALLNPDGTFTSFSDFNWNASPLANQVSAWLKTGEVSRYDHYSKVLETRDVNGLYSSQKFGHQQTRAVSSGSNARYTEMVYSGAEDRAAPNKLSTVRHFGGEVQDGDRQDALYHHTGQYSSKLLPPYVSGFTYKALIGTDVFIGRPYRLSAWVHSSDLSNNNGRLYASVNGTPLAETSITATTTKKSGDWYLLNLLFTIPASANNAPLTVGCRHTSGNSAPVYFDDFRFHPVDAPLSASVYDPYTWQVTYVLNNDNLFTRFEYDAAGKLMKVYKEALDQPNDICPAGGKLVKEYRYNYARGLQ